jgi:cytochrome bd-type quinol oxidase subunit 2
VIHTDAKITSTIYNGLLLIGSSLLSLITILFYKKRKLQVRLINVNMIVILAALFCMLIVYPKWIFPSNEFLKGTVLNFNFVLLISLFVAVGLYLAKKAILKDEALVRSTERLR